MQPNVEQVGDVLFIQWSEDRIDLALSRWRSHHAATYAECSITTTAPGIRPHLHTAVLNLTSGRSQAEFIKACTGGYQGPDWAHIIKQSCLIALDRRRMGEPVVDLSSLAAAPPTWRVEGWVPDAGVTLLYGDGGHGKSILALYLGACIAVGKSFLNLPVKSGKVLFLDFETESEEQAYQLRRIARGWEWTSLPPILYHRGEAPIAESGPELRYLCDQHSIDFVIVDSLGYAGAASNDAEPVVTVYRVLRTLARPVLAVHHVSKSNSDERTPFGSIYHRNSARSCIELRRVQEHDEEGLHLGLFHTKINRSRPQAPLGAQVVFSPDAVFIRPEDPKDVAGLADRVPLSVRLLDLLKRGALGPGAIAEELGLSEDDQETVERSLRRLRQRGKLTRLEDGRWGLSA